MAFDGIFVSGIKSELEKNLLGGRVYKVTEPERDEIILTIKNNSSTYKLSISVNPSLSLCMLTDVNKKSPINAPTFVMLLRKHIQNGKIVSITQPNVDRVIDMEIEHMNELGDMVSVHLCSEFMGKYSNIILCDNEYNILDSIKRVPSTVSSVREVLPGRKYFIPDGDKLSLDTLNKNELFESIRDKKCILQKAIYTSITGFSPVIANEICNNAGLPADLPATSMSSTEIEKLYNALMNLKSRIDNDEFTFAIYKDSYSNKPEFSAIPLTSGYYDSVEYESPSQLLSDFYNDKALRNRMTQKSFEYRRLTSNLLERETKKLALQEKQLESTLGRDKYRIYGELLQAYGYNVEEGATSITVPNFYDNNNNITIPLKNDLSPLENANAYFKKYNKLKRTFESVSELVEETKNEIDALRSVFNSLEISENEEDLSEIREELHSLGYIKKNSKEKLSKTPKPMHYISSNGFDIFVGKNNYQNEYVTFKLAEANDWWFHAKDMPGSHVIVKTNDKELPDKTFEEAAALAAYYSAAGNAKSNEQTKIEVDYVRRKELKKPPKANPGLVIYHTNYSLIANTDISALKKADE